MFLHCHSIILTPIIMADKEARGGGGVNSDPAGGGPDCVRGWLGHNWVPPGEAKLVFNREQGARRHIALTDVPWIHGMHSKVASFPLLHGNVV